MRKMYTTMLLAVLTAAAFAQKTFNDPNAEKRAVGSFHGIEVSSGIDLYLSQGEEAVAISANDEKYQQKIRTEVQDGILKIWFDYEFKTSHLFDWKNKKMKAYVSFKNLDILKGSGGSDIRVEGTIKVAKLAMEVSGGSDFDGKVNIADLAVEASGGSDVDIAGTAGKVMIEASGGSDFKGYELVSEYCTVDASGGSDVFITVNKELNADSSGGSDVHYKGEGLIRNIKNSGGSKVKRV